MTQLDAPRSMKSRLAGLMESAGMLAVLFGIILFCSLTVDNFFGLKNLNSLLLAVSTVGIISCTMLFCLASGNFDLSVGTVVPCAGVVAALVMNGTPYVTARFAHWLGAGTLGKMVSSLAGSSLFCIIFGIAAGLGLGALVGLINGIVVAKCKVNPLITTLATMQIVKGFAFIICDGRSVAFVDEKFLSFGNSAFPDIRDHFGGVVFQITVPVWTCLFCFALFGFLLQWTTFGRNTLAIGGNEEAARLSGISVDRIKIIIFTMQGLVAALAGIILAARYGSSQPKSSEGIELQVISACVLGGVSLTGGVGKMSFVIAGVFIMGVVQNAMNLRQVDPFYQYLVSGFILLAATLFDRFKERLKR